MQETSLLRTQSASSRNSVAHPADDIIERHDQLSERKRYESKRRHLG